MARTGFAIGLTKMLASCCLSTSEIRVTRMQRISLMLFKLKGGYGLIDYGVVRRLLIYHMLVIPGYTVTTIMRLITRYNSLNDI